jgi:adenosylhomocysteine nucleosidase
MPQELVGIRDKLEQSNGGRLSVFPYVEGYLNGRNVVVALTGVGKTNAAMVCSIFAVHFNPSEVVFTGTGSRLNPKLRTGDVVIGAKTCHHDVGTLNSKGMQYRSVRGPLKGPMTPWQFRADPGLLRLAREAAGTYRPQQITANGETYIPKVISGTICAGDVFGQSEARIRAIRKELKAQLMEMEGPAIAQVCRQLEIPHLVIRGGSNLTQENPGGDYRRLGPVAAHSAARFTRHFIGYLARNAIVSSDQ